MFLSILIMLLFKIDANELPKGLLTADILKMSKSSDWRTLDPENTLYMELLSGRVIIELTPNFSSEHRKNIKKLAQEKYWDGLAIVRVQDNYVVQWGDPNAEDKVLKKKIKTAKETLAVEFDTPLNEKMSFTALPDLDTYAPEVGFSYGFPVARDKQQKKMWLTHCYGMVGVGRNTPADSGGGAELYVVIGHSPRHLDRNVTLVGRVVQGIELLSSLPRGTGALGFYEKPEERTLIRSLRLASSFPKKERTEIEVLKTDTEVFKNYIEARRNRKDEWFHHKAGKIEICNVQVPVRKIQK